ncbi:MAG: antitoxin family protein [Acidobacteria bacterium]|nr:antitoxin family protein [Acidobacteriota bacterium]
MSITIEAIYEAGVFKPLTPVADINENEKVKLTVTPLSVIEHQRRNRLKGDPDFSREIGDSDEYSLLEA